MGDDAVTGVVIDPGHDLGLGPISEEHTTNDVELPQRHRRIAFPTLVVLATTTAFAGLDQAVTDQDPIHRRRRRHRRHPCPAELVRKATRTPTGMLPAHLAHRRLDLHGRLVRTPIRTMGSVDQPAQALFSIAGQPPVHGLRDTPIWAATSMTDSPARTASTAR